MNTEQQLRLRLASLLTNRLLAELGQLSIAAAAVRVAQKELAIVADDDTTETERTIRLRIASIYFEEAIGEIRKENVTERDRLITTARDAQCEVIRVYSGNKQ